MVLDDWAILLILHDRFIIIILSSSEFMGWAWTATIVA